MTYLQAYLAIWQCHFPGIVPQLLIFLFKTVSWFICFYSGSLLAITHLLLKHVSFPEICFHHLERDKLILSLEKFIFKFFVASSLAFQLVLRFFLDIRSRSYISEQIFDKCFFFFLIYLIFFEKNFFFRPWKVLYLNFFIHFIFLRQFFSIKGTWQMTVFKLAFFKLQKRWKKSFNFRSYRIDYFLMSKTF